MKAPSFSVTPGGAAQATLAIASAPAVISPARIRILLSWVFPIVPIRHGAAGVAGKLAPATGATRLARSHSTAQRCDYYCGLLGFTTPGTAGWLGSGGGGSFASVIAFSTAFWVIW